MFGQIKLENFDEIRLPQKAQSAWDGVPMNELVGVNYKPLMYVGAQEVNGILHWFIVERTLVYKNPIRHIIKMAILEKDGAYEFMEDSVIEIF